MNAMDLATLKAEIKAELLQEMRRAPGSARVPRPWNGIRDQFLKRLDGYGPRKEYQITSAISTMVRLALHLRSVLHMSEEQAPVAEAIANKIIDVLDEYSTGG